MRLPPLLVMGFGWVFATIMAGTAWTTHFARTQGAASSGALALTAAIWVLVGVLFVIGVAFAILEEIER